MKAVLFDADGVVQHPGVGRVEAFELVLGPGRAAHVQAFLQDIFVAEKSAYTSPYGFNTVLEDVLQKWECRGGVDDFLRAWRMIEVRKDLVDLIRTLRRSGIRCYLASNQESNRAAHMSAKLSYCDLFDREFYSCNVGFAKPDCAYFLHIVEALGLQGKDVLFIDDHEVNVVAAREAGLHAVTFNGDAGATVLWQTLAKFGIAVS
jgi:putative hydrolase of the HAD superfamily